MLQDSKAKSFKTLKSADKWLKNTDGLTKIHQKLLVEQSLKDILCAGTGLQNDSFYIASSDSDTLLLQTNNAVIATQFRMVSEQLLSQIDMHDLWQGRFNTIKVVVRPMYHKERSSQKTLRAISEENAKLIEEVAEYSENPKLKAVLKKLAQHRSSK
jgi:hypothetical protein